MRAVPQPQKQNFFIFISMIAALAGIIFGYATAVMSGAILFINEQFHLNSQSNGMVVSAVLLGAMLGSIVSGRAADQYGRRKLLISVALIFAVSSLLTAFAENITVLIIGRIIVGVAVGIASYTAPLYISEISPARYRGRLVSINQIAISLGILLSYVVDYMFAQGGLWREMFAFGVIPSGLLFIGMLFLPESPRWLITKNKLDDARTILVKILGVNSNQEIEQEVRDIQNTLTNTKAGWRTIFSKVVRPALMLTVALAAIQQFVGINIILYYAPTILAASGAQGSASAILAVIPIGIVFTLFTILGVPLIDKWGRRPLLILGLIGMCVGWALLAWTFSYHEQTGALHWLTTTAMWLYIACFAFSLGPVMWLLISEVFPLSVRGLGSSVATSVNWASNMLVTFTFLSLVQYLGTGGTFWLYFVLSILSLIFIYFFVPETKNVSLEQIEANLYAGKSSRHIGA